MSGNTNRMFTRDSLKNFYIERPDRRKKSKFICPLCPASFKSDDKYKAHYKLVHIKVLR